MPGKTAIEWATDTWNPVTGCTKVSPGCANCYIDRSPPFRIAGRKFDNTGATDLILHRDRLDTPLRWTRPRMIFVNSLSDLFHEAIPYEFVRDVFNTMRCCDGGVTAATGRRRPRHIFQVLTKRPEQALRLWQERKLGFTDWPDHIWLGVTVENARFTGRADVLRQIPAKVRFLSCEPLLGPLLNPLWTKPPRRPLDLTEIDWVICGGESGGRQVRPMHPSWARELRDACLTRKTAFFLKQWGSYAPVPDSPRRPVRYGNVLDARRSGVPVDYGRDVWVGERGGEVVRLDSGRPQPPNAAAMRYVGVGGKSGGKLLDGREWCEMPGDEREAA